MASTDERDRSSALAAPPDGDDITVVHSPDPAPRRWWLWPVIAVAGLLAVVAGAYLVTRGNPSDRPSIDVLAPPLAPTPSTAPRPVAKPPTKVTTRTSTPAPVVSAPTTVAVAGHQPASPGATVAPPRNIVLPPAAGPAPAPTTAAPTASPVSVLRWTLPSGLTVKAGDPLTFIVRVTNPSAGVVTLPHPLSCAPQLDHLEVCPEVAQLLAPGASLAQSFIIATTGTAPGSYTLSIEGIRTIPVTVTA